MSIINSLLKLFVGDKSKQDIKSILPIVDKIKSFESSLKLISNDQLRNKTLEFKEYIKSSVAGFEESINKLKSEAKIISDIDRKENIYAEIDELNDKIYFTTQETLDKILPEAFAVVKETAKRFFENTEIITKANAFDREIAGKNEYVKLKQSNAIWSNSWDAAGKAIVWDMIHYDVQLIGGVAMHKGKIAEMQTGEGKTLVATLPVYLNALTGKAYT